MTSARGQNVSVLKFQGTSEPWDPPITIFSDSGGSLRSAPRGHFPSYEKKPFLNGKTPEQHAGVSNGNSFAGRYSGRDVGSNKSFGVVIGGGVGTSALNSVNRELSPVRWCDREVDGVYLGRSGWVQVQQRSLDETKKLVAEKGGGVPGLPARPNGSNGGRGNEERVERVRPVYLPLLAEQRKLRTMPRNSSSFAEELKAGSPPSITPIISPPPAFKDSQLHPLRKNYPDKAATLHRPRAIVADAERSSKPQQSGWNSLSSPPLEDLLPFGDPAERRHGHLSRVLQTKSLDGDVSSERHSNSARHLTTIGFRSLDGSARRESPVYRFGENDSFARRILDGRDKVSYEENDYSEEDDDDEDDDENRNRVYLRMKSSPLEGLEKPRIASAGFRERNHQRFGRRTPNRSTSSSSLDSSSSGSPVPSCRRFNSRKSQDESEHSQNDRHFTVKRSRSLQLSEKQSPNEIPMMSHSSSGKCWNQTASDYVPRQAKNQNNLQNSHLSESLHQVVVSMNGQSVPLMSSCEPHLKHSNKITHSEELLREAQKEARIVSEFLNGTRSRAAARNLLIHRYFNRPEDEAATATATATRTPSETEYGVHFLGTDRRSQNEARRHLEKTRGPEFSSGESRFGRSHPPSTRATVNHFNPFPPSLQAPENSEPSSRSGSLKLAQTFSEQIKSGKAGRREGRRPLAGLHSTNGYDQSKKLHAVDVGKPSGFSNQGRDVLSMPGRSRLFFSNPKPKAQPQNGEKQTPFPPPGNETEEERTVDESPREGSSSLSSSSSGIWQISSGGKNSRTRTSSSTLDGRAVADSRSSTPGRHPESLQESLRPRPESAPTSGPRVARGVEQRSLSLPRSFLSERYGFRQARQRSTLPLKQHSLETSTCGTLADGWTQLVSRTAPATPVRGLGECRDEDLCKNQCTRSASTTLLDEPSTKPEWTAQKTPPERMENYGESLSSRRSSLSVNGMSYPKESSPDGVLQKFKKSLSSKFSKSSRGTAGNEEVKYTTEGNECEVRLFQNSLQYLNAGLRNDDAVPDPKFRFGSLGWRSTEERRKAKRAHKNGKYGSRDSGIQIGNLDSSTSQENDLHADVGSPPVIQRSEVSATEKSCRPQSEVLNQFLANKFEVDVQWRSVTKKEHVNERGVRRTNSDLGGQRLFNWDRHNFHKRLTSTPSPVRGRNGDMRRQRSDDSMSSGRYLLWRSVSQPLGLNEWPPFARRRRSGTKGLTLSEDEHNPRGGNSEEELISDSEVSAASMSERRRSQETSLDEEVVALAEAVWDHVAIEPCELPFRAGDVIQVMDMHRRDWWWGATSENCGYFPSAFVRLRVSQEDTVEDCLAAMIQGKQTSGQLRRGKSVSLLSNDQVRSSVVRELLNTERDFVKILHDITEGFMLECKRRADMFTPAQVATIFSNIVEILSFQEKFLKDLEERVDPKHPHKSCIGEVFLNHSCGFQMYSEYCNSHPMAMATLQELCQRNGYNEFFETCRLMRSLIEIPLDGYLLTPIQRICKYPLQLAELLKYTKPEHPDHEKVGEALKTMKGVATLINERKRKMESLEKLAAWQQRVEGWEGEDLIEVSSRLIHHGDAVRITSGKWTTNITLFLFDHQIIYCKKDLLKRNTYIYKGRLSLDGSDVIDVPDGKDAHLGITVRHGLKISNYFDEKWLFFCCRSSEEKAMWLEALAEEKRLVAQDKEGGLDLSPAAKELAKMAARTKGGPPSKLKNKNKINYEKASARTIRPSPARVKMSRKMGTWLNFGGVIRNPRVSLRPQRSLQGVT